MFRRSLQAAARSRPSSSSPPTASARACASAPASNASAGAIRKSASSPRSRMRSPHDGKAVQHFLPGGPFAMLPLQGQPLLHRVDRRQSDRRGDHGGRRGDVPRRARQALRREARRHRACRPAPILPARFAGRAQLRGRTARAGRRRRACRPSARRAGPQYRASRRGGAHRDRRRGRAARDRYRRERRCSSATSAGGDSTAPSRPR